MFRIVGDEIEYERTPFARILMPAFSTLRQYAEDAIWLADPDKVERENNEWRREVEAEHAKEIEERDAKIEALQTEVDKWLGELNTIDDYGGVSARIEALMEETAKWREIAETNRQAYLELTKPKPRKRRKA